MEKFVENLQNNLEIDSNDLKKIIVIIKALISQYKKQEIEFEEIIYYLSDIGI